MTEHLVVKIQKWVIWGVLAYVVYLMHSLFTVVFLTFILSYIGNSAVSFLTRRFQYRRFNLTLIYFVFISLLLAFASVVIPRVFSEARDLAQHQIVESQSDTMPQVPVAMHGPLADGDTQARAASPVLTRETKKYLDRAIIQIMGRDYFQTFRKSSAYDDLVVKVEDYITAFIPRIVDGVKGFVNNLLKVAFHFLLSIIFSFLIIWDLPRLSESVRSFGQGRTAEAYAEISPGLRAFGVMLGKAFEAQTGIAFVNATLTAIGFWLLDIPSLALLSTIVFFCSYIPVLGVILSSLPAALLAFKIGGIITVLWLVVMVLAVHAIETYMLNPIIYGHHLKMHPVGVLVILLTGEHLFGLWGMILGVPVSAFVLKYVLQGEQIE
ncbi:MAG: AI-2E family transporter [Candidatus Hydrogenedentota bacterium]